MAWEEVRIANEAGRAVVVLSPSLTTVHWANSAGVALLSLLPAQAGRTRELDPSTPAGRQVASMADALASTGEAMARVGGTPGTQGAASTAHVFLATVEPGEEVALLTALVPGFSREPREVLAARLFREASTDSAPCALVDETGLLIRSAALDEARADELVELAQEFLVSGEALFTLEDAGETIVFARIGSEFAFMRVLEPEAVEDARPEAHAPSVSGQAEPARPVTAMSALIDRWHRRIHPPAPAAAELPGVGQAPPPSDAAKPQVPTAAPAVEPAQLGAAGRPPFVPRFDVEPVRFVWQIDADGRFRSLSPEFADAVGPAAADVLGKSFAEVARAFRFDEKGEIEGLMQRRDTWSGRCVHWPVEGSERKALVDLAALPMYDASRTFQGFRGFGIVRLAETIADSEAIGKRLAAQGWKSLLPASSSPEPEPETATVDAPTAVADAPPPEDRPSDARAAAAPTPPGERRLGRLTQRAAADAGPTADEPQTRSFGRRPSPPRSAPSETVVRLDERRPTREKPLSPAEEDAFRAIGAELKPAVRTERGEEAPRLDDEIAALFASMPLPALLQVRETPVFASAKFFDYTGYESLSAFLEAGGLDHLFVDEPAAAPGQSVGLRHASGERLEARVQMQRVTLAGRSCLVFFFVPLAETGAAETAAEADAAETFELRDEIAELHAVLDTATDGIMLLDAGGRIRSMNGSAEALLGLAPEAYEKRHFADFLAPESRQPAIDYLEMLRDGGLAGILNDGREVEGQVAQGGTVPLFITIGRLSGERGWCLVMRDIAHWKRVEAELVAARRQAEDASLHKSRFLANISHELRTPLNAIIGFADVMSSECFGPIGHERYLEYLGDIKRSGHHVLDLVNDLLDISKIEAGKVELSFEAVSLNEVVSEVVSLMQPQANRERVIVRSNLPATIPPVVADRRSVRQIALNLIANAIRFTPAGGQIIASTSYAPTGEVSLRFRDSGIGMTDREIEIALTPFQQVNASAKDRGDGTGLGLPLTKAMVEANRAQFAIASAPGEGTVIEITFPSQRVLAD